MPTPERPRRPRRLSTRLGLAAVKGAALGGLLTVVVVNGLAVTSPSTTSAADEPAVDAAYRQVVERAVSDHDCSYSGFSDTIPSSALVRTPRGAVRQVSFDVGWEVYQGRRPGTLIAVCLDPLAS